FAIGEKDGGGGHEPPRSVRLFLPERAIGSRVVEPVLGTAQPRHPAVSAGRGGGVEGGCHANLRASARMKAKPPGRDRMAVIAEPTRTKRMADRRSVGRPPG